MIGTHTVDGIQYRAGNMPSLNAKNSMITSQATKSVANAYMKVMDEVCNTVRETFLDEGVDISVLEELRRIWENKLYQSKVLDPSRTYQEVSRTHAGMSGVAMPGYSHQQQNLSMLDRRMTSNMPQVYQISQNQTIGNLPIRLAGTQSQQPGAIRVMRPQSQNAPSVMYAKQPYTTSNFPQLDGAMVDLSQLQPSCSSSKFVLQLDGGKGQPHSSDDDDEDSDEFVDDDEPKAKHQKTISTKHSSASASVRLAKKGSANDLEDTGDEDDDSDEDDIKLKEEVDGDENEEEPLNSEDDVTDDETSLPPSVASGGGGGSDLAGARSAFGCEDVVVCQYEKVRRQKNRWHIVLKDGIMNVQGRDVLFHRAEIDCEW